MKSVKQTDILTGSIPKQLLLFFLPIWFGTLFQQLYNTADTLIVGNFVGTNALAAVGATGPFVNLLVGLFVGLCSGAGVVIAQSWGAHDPDAVDRQVHTALVLSAAVGALLTVGAALVWGVYSVLIRVLGHMGYQTVPLTCRIFGYGFLFLLIPTAFEGLPAGIAAWGTPVHLANLLFLGLLASATCFVTWNRAVFLLGPVRTSVYIYASPVITIIASALILHETMTPVMWVGTALALGGLMLSEKKTKKS